MVSNLNFNYKIPKNQVIKQHYFCLKITMNHTLLMSEPSEDRCSYSAWIFKCHLCGGGRGGGG